MWVIKLILSLVLLLALVYFFDVNEDQTVDLVVLDREYLAVPLVVVVLISFGVGFLVALAAMGLREWRLRRELRRLRKQNTVQDRELADLRALPLQELSGEAGGKDT